jgi:hypothetical protein
MPSSNGLRAIYIHSFATGRSTLIQDAHLREGQWLTISPDGKTLLHDESTEISADTMVLENFRKILVSALQGLGIDREVCRALKDHSRDTPLTVFGRSGSPS